jgi:N-glycosylase/DNA lyase
MTTAGLIADSALRNLVVDLHSGKFSVAREKDKARPRRSEIFNTLICCLLSSGWRYEKAVKTSQLFLSSFDINNQIPSESSIEIFLRSPQVRHRFPKVKAKQLGMALNVLSSFPEDILYNATSASEERLIRSILSRRLPGLGYKQTSMFLRNIGASEHLAVIDAHVLWYLESCFGTTVKNVTSGRYIELEDKIRAIASSFDVSLNDFDLLLWVVVREFKKKRTTECMMQYALPLAD